MIIDLAAKGSPTCCGCCMTTLTSLCKPRHTTLMNVEVQRSKSFHTAVTNYSPLYTMLTLNLFSVHNNNVLAVPCVFGRLCTELKDN